MGSFKLFLPYDGGDQGSRCIQQAQVLAEDSGCSQGVELDGALPATVPVHEGFEEGMGAVMEGLVVRVTRNAMGIKGDNCIDIGLR